MNLRYLFVDWEEIGKEISERNRDRGRASEINLKLG